MANNDTTRRLPDTRWLPVVAIALVLWAATLGLWWSRLLAAKTTLAVVQPRSTLAPTAAARPTSQPSEAPTTAPAGTPAVVSVVRQPGQLVLEENWEALAQAFDVEQALGYIAELVKPEYAGRAVGSPGGWLAGDWIAERFAEYGLQPAGDGGTYFQEFPVPYTELTAMPTLELLDEAGQSLTEYRFRYDYTIWPGDGYTDGGAAEGPVYWLNIGEHDDYDEVNVQGGIVVCRYERPFDDMQRQALEHGAKALLMIKPEDLDFRMRRTARSSALLPEGIPTLIISEDVMADLLLDSNLTLDDLSIQYKAVGLQTRLRINVPLEYRQDVYGRNVLGVIPGSDADGVDQVVILGAHYDHMGADPDGTIWHGANDDASGVAVLLEIARVWQEQGYVPKRTVLFAAWDGEEIGLNGSVHYVTHASYPLTMTVGMLQLDMVGAGTSRLVLDRGGVVADQSAQSAQRLGIPIVREEGGGSDHVPFAQSGVPATNYIWWAGRASGLVYHVPEDDLSNIDAGRLESAGELANLVALDLSWEHEELEDLVAAYQAAVAGRDRESLLAVLDPADERLQQEQKDWLATIVQHLGSEFVVTTSQPLVAADLATSTVSLRYRWDPDDSLSTASFPAHWVRRGLDWYYDGLAWNQAQGEHVVVMHLDQRSLADRMVEAADEWYAFFTEQATWALPQKVYIRFYGVGGATDDAAISLAGSRNLLHALQDAPSGYQASSGWPVDDGIVLSDNANLQTTLTEFALAQAGWPSPTTSWMAQGLTDHLTMTDTAAAEQLKSEYLSTLLQADDEGRLWAAEAMPTRWEVQPGDRNTWDAQAWAMTDYLLQGSGWTGMQRPVSAISDAWRIALLDPWLDVAQGIEKTLEQRAEAILSQDREAFLSTVDAHNSVLYVEETHWFDDLAPYPADRFAYESELLELNGEEAIVNLQVRYRVPSVEWAPLTPSYQARFVQRDGQWLYSGLDFSEQRSEHFVLKYESADYAPYAPRLLAEAERAYVQVTSDLEAHPKTPIEIKLYHHTDVFRFSIYMSMPQITGWNEPGEAIKLNVAGREAFLEQGAPRVIAHELTHAVLFAMGVQHGALHEGICEDEAIRFDPVTGNTKLRQYRREVYDLVRSQRPITVHDLADWREVSSDDLHLFYSVGWDFVTYFRQRFGRQRLLAWLKLLGSGLTFEEAFAQAAGLPFATVDAEWRESVLRGHIPAEYIETALAFDPEQALGHVVRLAAPEWAGREAGTAGNEAAAQYVAERFAAYGLEPAGDAGSYLQHFPVSRVALSDTPELVIASDDGQELRLRYRSDFHELLGASAGSGQVDRTIVYVRDPLNAEVHLGGRVLLTHLGTDVWQQVEAAIRVGAGGVLLMTTKWEKDMAVKAGVVQSLNTESLPVLELTKQASEALFGLLGYRTHQIDDLPAILPLPLAAKMKVQAVASPDAQAANVLGILPGSDPELSSQVLILSAHLDHVGSLPDGTVFPGANNDASGVAVMLEIARLWHEAGYQPRRSVLFAAWNAAEMGSLGSSYYVAHPAYPLRDTVDLIQLDEVGAAKGYYILVPGDDTQEALILAHLDNAARQVEGRLTFERYRAGSDQDPFHRRGVPALVLTWDEPLNRYVPEDTPDTLDLQKLQAMGRVVALTMMTMADD